MHIHILGICGTFMGSLALLARTLGHTVTGSDTNIYPPMSTQLEHAGITIAEGYLVQHLQPAPDLVVVGNAMKRGMEVVEYMLDTGLRYTSGPQFLSEQVLQSRHVLAVAGTHGKTTTTTMLAWILHYAGIDAGFLIGGVPLVNTPDEHLQQVFAHSSYLGADDSTSRTNNSENETTAQPKPGYFVIEADEYDSAFFDKRSKFVHYRPRTAILNNLEFDHADIFADLNAIQTQFHHMVRMIPSTGKIIMPAATISLEETLAKGVWTPIWRTAIIDKQSDSEQKVNDQSLDNQLHDQQEDSAAINSNWQAELINQDGSQFKVSFAEGMTADTETTAIINWSMSGIHNVNNALVAVAAAYDIGVNVTTACAALSAFAGIKRRMELIGNINDILVFDDFAHHPTAITTTLDGAKKKLSGRRIWAIIEPRSNTMKMGIHQDSLAQSATLADHTLWYEPADLKWGLKDIIDRAHMDDEHHGTQQVIRSVDAIIEHVITHAQAGDAIIIMSNGDFEGIHERLLTALRQL
ncbi:UDP-N-acetylmuramate: L-alanyl-gamma-D-glutamyl-meso-diaminopimelate ligase [Psychrobacter sp. PL15]|uniref:Mur ligase domain-containing protein n=1 Tax=Psychrobacter sp. PL15 TaxID=3071719 RepID=UPI002E008F57|nr:UDP-N-acetylmuramate: L-alanyl-gamma-D-glutamyl-meso-diaminopimelate ligase [Psychrobacter sp. PL15]